ncbi:MAG: hypothetical protein K0R57_5081 [Paenibacillaceae bacterium]|nr:hypothetical protein [Paenibacillaceae bacterium]
MNTENTNTEAANAGEVKKTGLAEAAKRMLERKKQAQNQNKGGKNHQSTEAQKMKSQMTKKINNQKRRTGV